MAYNDGTWTDEKPEVGKRYWYTYWQPHLRRWASPLKMEIEQDEPWNPHGSLRSVHPIPDPTPPPLPSKETR